MLRIGSYVGLGRRLQFLRGYFRDPNVVGALAPSSRALASALCEPFRRHPRPATVLEVGAGTGAITRYLGSIFGDEDELDICEIKPEFAEILKRDVLSQGDFAFAVAAGRVRVIQTAVQELAYENRYDFIISCLPFTAFELRDVEDVFGVLQQCLKPGGVLSYYEYLGLRKTSRFFSLGRRRARIRSVSDYLARNIREHQFDRKTVFQNLPPAHARHLRFDCRMTNDE